MQDSIKYLALIMMLFTSHSPSVAAATESIDCTTENIWFQFHFNLRSSKYAGFTLNMEDGVLSITEVSQKIDFENRNINFSGQSDKGAVIFRSRGNAGVLNIGNIEHKLNCDWMAYIENT